MMMMNSDSIYLRVVLIIATSIMFIDSSYSQDSYSNFISGNRKVCESDGTGKAKGLKFRFEYPSDWVELDTDRPNMVKKVANNKSAEIQIIVGVYQIEPFSEFQKDYFLSSDMMERELLSSSNGYDYKIDKITTDLRIDGEKASSIEYTSILKRLDYSIKLKSIMYYIYYDKYHITIGVGMTPIGVDLNNYYKKNKKLLDLIVSSFVIISKWY